MSKSFFIIQTIQRIKKYVSSSVGAVTLSYLSPEQYANFDFLPSPTRSIKYLFSQACWHYPFVLLFDERRAER